jgi:hypothetical protein
MLAPGRVIAASFEARDRNIQETHLAEEHTCWCGKQSAGREPPCPLQEQVDGSSVDIKTS